MTNSDRLLELQDVDIAIEDTQIVDSISMNLAKGEAVGLIGRNGAGKTTTFRRR